MFEHLIESQKKRSWRTMLGNSAASIVFHVIMILVAVYATLNAGQNVVERIQTVAVTMQTQEKKEEPPPPEQEVATVAPPPKGFQTLAIPTSIPVDIPPPQQNTNFNAADFSGVGVEGGVARGVEGGTGPVISDQPYLEAVVEDRPERIENSCIQPRYPAILQQAGVEGRVLAEFVIDTLGRAERASIRFVTSSHNLFEASARETIISCRYRPGRISGRAVRVRVQMPINFAITR